MSRLDSLTLLSVNICSILYLKCASSHNYTWSVDTHTYIHSHMNMRVVIYKCLMMYDKICIMDVIAADRSFLTAIYQSEQTLNDQ